MSILLIPGRFNGPPESGQGGVTAGRVAAFVSSDSPITVTLRVPPPLDVPMRVDDSGPTLRVYHRATLVAEANRAEPDALGARVPAVTFAEAMTAAKKYPGFTAHPFPTCFVCGTQRRDGMAVFPGPLGSDPQHTAAPFMPREIFDPVLVWAVLDCPGGWTLNLPFRPTVLGRMTAQILDVPAIGEQCVVVGMLDHREGRKAYTRTTAYGADGRTLGQAAATWIEIAR